MHSNIAFRTNTLKKQVDSWLDKEFPFSDDTLAITGCIEPELKLAHVAEFTMDVNDKKEDDMNACFPQEFYLQL